MVCAALRYPDPIPNTTEGRFLTIEPHLVLKALDVLDVVKTIRSVKVRVRNAICGVEHRFEKTANRKEFEHMPREKQLEHKHGPRVLLKNGDGYRFSEEREATRTPSS